MDEELIQILIEQYIENRLEIRVRDVTREDSLSFMSLDNCRIVELVLNDNVISSDWIEL
ncbi:hypothetical protein VP14_062 [Vibrio phage VPMCC14]|nr:hypothetical protein VP14_062 [Vibrio phage VPMCC14]